MRHLRFFQRYAPGQFNILQNSPFPDIHTSDRLNLNHASGSLTRVPENEPQYQNLSNVVVRRNSSKRGNVWRSESHDVLKNRQQPLKAHVHSNNHTKNHSVLQNVVQNGQQNCQQNAHQNVQNIQKIPSLMPNQMCSPANSSNSSQSNNPPDRDSGYISQSLNSIGEKNLVLHSKISKAPKISPKISRIPKPQTIQSKIQSDNHPNKPFSQTTHYHSAHHFNTYLSPQLKNSSDNFSHKLDSKAQQEQISRVARTFSMVTAEHAEKMTKLSTHMYTIIKDWALEIAPADFSIFRPHEKKPTVSIHSTSCMQVLQSIQVLISSLSPRMGNQFEGLKNEILKKYDDTKKEQANFREITETITKNGNIIKTRDNIPRIPSLASENPGLSIFLNDFKTASTKLHFHLSVAQLYHMNNINPCDLAMAGIRTLTANQQERVDLMSSISQSDSLKRYVEWCERLSSLVSFEILKCQDLEKRAKYLEILSDTALKCVYSGDLCSAMAIWSGLSIMAVTRLQKTWKKINPCKHLVLEHLFDPNKNFQNYRAVLRHVATTKNTKSENTSNHAFLIPSMSLLLKDLLYLTKKAADRKIDHQVLIERWIKLATPVIRFKQWTAQGFKVLGRSQNTQKIDEGLLNYLKVCPEPTAEMMLNLKRGHGKKPRVGQTALFDIGSYSLEPANNKWEKQQFRTYIQRQKQMLHCS